MQFWRKFCLFKFFNFHFTWNKTLEIKKCKMFVSFIHWWRMCISQAELVNIWMVSFKYYPLPFSEINIFNVFLFEQLIQSYKHTLLILPRETVLISVIQGISCNTRVWLWYDPMSINDWCLVNWSFLMWGWSW